MSLYVTSSCGLTNSATTITTITDDLLSLKPDSTFDLVHFSTSQDLLLPQMKATPPSYAKLQNASLLPENSSSATVTNDSGQDSDSSSEDTTKVLLNAEANKDPSTKPSLSYIALISMAIQSNPQKRMLLSEIYQWITEKFPYYQGKDKSWRNSIRHNLSLNECFIKNGRSENGKGNYWSIHPANVEDFGKGDFRRRRARRRVRKCDEMQRRLCQEGANMPQRDTSYYSSYNSYVPMMSTYASTPALSNIFGVENVLSREEQLQRYYQQLSNTKPLPNITNVSSVFANTEPLLNSSYQNASVPSLHQNSVSSLHQNTMNPTLVTTQATIPTVYQPTIASVHQTTIPSMHQTSIPSAQAMPNVPSFQDNLFTQQVQTQTLPSMSLAGALPSWQDTLSRLQTDLGGTV
jgi:hypothetical protein